MGPSVCFPTEKALTLSPLYTGRLFHCYMLDESMSYRGCHIYFVAFILFLMEKLLANTVDPDQTLQYLAPDLGLHCLPMTYLWVSRQEWVKTRGRKFIPLIVDLIEKRGKK